MASRRAILSQASGGDPLPNGVRTVATPAGDPPLRIFRDVLRLRFALDGAAEEIVLDPAALILRAHFEPLEYDALAPGAPGGKATLRAHGGAVVLELDAPRRVVAVGLAPGRATGLTLRVHRVDNEAIAGEPTVTASREGARGGGAMFRLDVTDARLALRLHDNAGNPVPFTPADVSLVRVRSHPLTPRLGLAALPSDTDPAPLWQAPGEIGGNVPLEDGVMDAGPALAAALARHFAALSPLPDLVEVALVVTSDAPCRWNLSAYDVPFRLARRSFASGADRETVRFAAGGAADRPVLLRLPGQAGVVAARLEVSPGLRADRPVAEGAIPAGEPAESTGLRVDSAAWVAQEVTPPQAVAVTGVSLGLLALTAGAALSFELREDAGGEPTGRTLAAGGLEIERAGRATWLRVPFPSPVVLPAAPVWLLLAAVRGEAVWLARDAPSSRIRRLARPGLPPAGAGQSAVDGLETLHRLLSASGEALRQSPPLQVRLDGQSVSAQEGGDPQGRMVFDLTTVLAAWLKGKEQTPQDVPLELVSAVPGTATVYPPRVEYEPG
jgi:hypothetical protein